MRRRIVLLAAGAAGLAVAAWAIRPGPPSEPDWAHAYEVTARPPDAIPPGTVIDRTAPPGWSHLVIKSKPRIRPDQRPLVNDLTARMAGWMFTAFLADVRPDDTGRPRHRLRTVALGLGCTVDGRDVVITPEAAAEHGADLGWITRTILTAGYERQRQAVVAIHGPTLGLVDTPVWFRTDGKHRLIRFRYALLVDAADGKLDVLAWAVDPERGDPELAVRLAPDTIDEAELLVDPDEFTFGVPSEAAFAVDRLPPGRGPFPLPPDLRPLAGATRFTPDTARELEAGLRRLPARDDPGP
jgi:hypothetical protein